MPTDTDEFVSASCTDGAYRVLIKNPEKPQSIRIVFSTGPEVLSVAADATYKAGTKNAGYGVSCWASEEQGVSGYLFLITPAAAWLILRWKNGRRPLALAESATDHAIPGFSRVNRIRGECIGGGKKPTVLALYVNGKKIATAEDRGGLESFPGFGLTVVSTEGGTDVRFDNFVARKVTEAEVRLARAATKPTQTPTGTTSKPSASKLCKEDGIRYAGTTAQGAEVCLTLSPDGSELVETGFSFVRASGCRGKATGTVHSDYPGTIDPSGRVENPDGLTATIRGGTASGVFADSICPGKKFQWSAHRVP